jgi:hypothetical protein
MSVVISDEILHTTRMSAGEIMQELAILLFQKGEVNTWAGKPVGRNDAITVSALIGQPADTNSL